jgi:hypothetical protein
LPAAITITFAVMRRLVAKLLIIGAALLGLGGCTALRLGYDNAPALAWWWLDGYADFSREQTPPVKDAIGRWFAWHRSTQLGDYAALLAAAQGELMQPTTADAVCRWNARVRGLLEPAVERGVQEAARVLPLLGEAQWRHVEQRQAKAMDEMRNEFLPADAAERQRAAVKRAVQRFERLYGRLNDAQRQIIAAGVAESPFDPAAWAAERERRQKETLAVLRRLSAERADADTRVAALRMLAERMQLSADPGYREMQQRGALHQCALVARVHNAATPAQRERARGMARGWEEDLRALAAAGAGSAAAATVRAAER